VPYCVHIPVNNIWEEFRYLEDQNLGFWVKRVGTRNFLTELMNGRLSERQVSYERADPVMVSEPCRSCPNQNPVNYLLYSNGILSYLRYLLCVPVGWFCCSIEMAGGNGRNDDAIVAALTAVAQVLAQAQGNGCHGQEDQGEVEERRLDRFMRNKPPTFKGRFDPERALTWKESMERIFRAMVTNDDQKVRLATHMFVEEAEYWWMSTKRSIEASGDVVTWVRFKSEFLKKYFLEDLRNKKEAEFLNLKQGSMSIAEYAAKYEELSRFCPYINVDDAMVSKCVKFENGLRLEIYQYICFHEIRDFDTLVHKCRMFDDAGKAR